MVLWLDLIKALLILAVMVHFFTGWAIAVIGLNPFKVIYEFYREMWEGFKDRISFREHNREIRKLNKELEYFKKIADFERQKRDIEARINSYKKEGL